MNETITRLIPLSQGKYAIVDAADYEELMRWKWCYSHGYAMRNTPRPRKGSVFLHRQIMNPPDGLYVDHINGDRLDNRRCNLRIVTKRQNNINVPIQRNNTSGYKGVGYYKRVGKWRAYITLHGKQKSLGYYATPEEANAAYQQASRIHFGEYAR